MAYNETQIRIDKLKNLIMQVMTEDNGMKCSLQHRIDKCASRYNCKASDICEALKRWGQEMLIPRNVYSDKNIYDIEESVPSYEEVEDEVNNSDIDRDSVTDYTDDFTESEYKEYADEEDKAHGIPLPDEGVPGFVLDYKNLKKGHGIFISSMSREYDVIPEEIVEKLISYGCNIIPEKYENVAYAIDNRQDIIRKYKSCNTNRNRLICIIENSELFGVRPVYIARILEHEGLEVPVRYRIETRDKLKEYGRHGADKTHKSNEPKNEEETIMNQTNDEVKEVIDEVNPVHGDTYYATIIMALDNQKKDIENTISEIEDVIRTYMDRIESNKKLLKNILDTMNEVNKEHDRSNT